MASRIKMWSLERTIQSLEIHYQDGHWGLGLYSNALGNEADPYDEDSTIVSFLTRSWKKPCFLSIACLVSEMKLIGFLNMYKNDFIR